MKNKIKIITSILLLMFIFSPISVNAAKNNDDENYVILGGETFGIKMFSDGLIVIGTEDFETENGCLCPAEIAGIKENDTIISANNIKLSSCNQLKEMISNCEGKEIILEIEREGQKLNLMLQPLKNTTGKYCAGIWVKDSAAGLGTITFYSTEYEAFCGLGHGICDKDTGKLIPLDYGEVDLATVTSVTKSTNGCVGTLNGYFTNDLIGTATINNEKGIYGTLSTENIEGEKIEIASSEVIEKGAAYIYTTIGEGDPQYYEIKIVEIDRYDENVNMTIKITDEELLNVTGGIVQGMSGSPIIQNDKLIGALTHVLVDDVAYGYGIFAETMLETMEENC